MKILILLSFWIFTFSNLNSQNIVFEIDENCNRISRKSYRCCGKVLIYSNGLFESNVKTSSNRWTGFKGAIKIEFKDSNRKIIYTKKSPYYGVNAKSYRIDYWTDKIPLWVLDKAEYASVSGFQRKTITLPAFNH